jgi:hypothetical protein
MFRGRLTFPCSTIEGGGVRWVGCKQGVHLLPVSQQACCTHLAITVLKGILQRILSRVDTMLKKSVLVNWRPTRFSF